MEKKGSSLTPNKLCSTKEVGAVFQSKNELEKFLRSDCDAFLPDHEYCTVYHYRDLVSGRKVCFEAQFKNFNATIKD